MNSRFKFYEWYSNSEVLNPAVVVYNGINYAINMDGSVFHADYNVPSKYWKSTTYEKVVSRIRLNFRLNLVKSLKLIGFNNEPVVVTKEQRQEIIDTLTKNRAHNGDSAHKFGDDKMDIAFSLAESGCIKNYDNKYYLDN